MGDLGAGGGGRVWEGERGKRTEECKEQGKGWEVNYNSIVMLPFKFELSGSACNNSIPLNLPFKQYAS